MTYNDVKSQDVKIISGIAKVIDGDTIQIDKKKIRFFGIDAPEKKQQCSKPWLTISFLNFNKEYPCGEFSKNKLINLIKNKSIICKLRNKDIYGRLIAECFKNKININSWMVEHGYAVAYKKYSKKYINQENIAKKNKLGLWAGTFEMPWIWRKKN